MAKSLNMSTNYLNNKHGFKNWIGQAGSTGN